MHLKRPYRSWELRSIWYVCILWHMLKNDLKYNNWTSKLTVSVKNKNLKNLKFQHALFFITKFSLRRKIKKSFKKLILTAEMAT